MARDVAALEEHGVVVQRRVFFAHCDKCARDGELTISQCFLPSPTGGKNLRGFVCVAGMGPNHGPPERQASVELVTRLTQSRMGEPSEPGYTDRITAREFLCEIEAGKGVREELREALAGALTFQDVQDMRQRRRGARGTLRTEA